MGKEQCRWILGAALPAGALAVFFAISGTPASVEAQGRGPEYVPGEVLVQFKVSASQEQKEAALERASARAREHMRTPPMKAAGGLGVVVAATGRDVPGTVRMLASDPTVEFAEPNWIYTHQATSNDPYYTQGYLWGMYGDASAPLNRNGSQSGEAWTFERTGSKAVYVGVIDEGVQTTHPDLDGTIWVNPYDRPDGIDNDGNGYRDDLNGWDFAANNNTVYDGGTTGAADTHGTHVAGTIGAEGGNGAGVAGVNWRVNIISAKFLSTGGGTSLNAIRALDYLTNLKTRHGLNIVAVNNSWGGGGYSQALLDAITRAAKANILFIAAAGNGGGDGIGDNNDAMAYYPASYDTTAGAGYDSVIAVAALRSDGTLASYSNYGARRVDLGAPGSSIWSTLPYNRYGAYSGTSMATPHVTGAAALYASTHPGASALTIKNAILNAARATPTPALSGRSVTGGRLNVSGF